MLILISTFALFMIALGWKFRQQAKIHIACMTIAFVIDFGLVLYIELTRHAVEKFGEVLVSATPNLLLYFHIAVSVLTLGLYAAQIASGFKLFRGHALSRELHRRLAYAFLAARLTNYVTSFFVPASV